MTDDEPNKRREWSSDPASLRSRLSALCSVVSPTARTKVTSAIAATPSLEPRTGGPDTTFVDVYKIWYVLHHDRLGDERTTNLYTRKIGEAVADPEDVVESSIQVYLLPVDHRDWLDAYEGLTGDGEVRSDE